MNKIKFSIPLWPLLSPQEVDAILPVLDECRPIIQDLYYTSRTPPFTSDAMGGVLAEQDAAAVENNALAIGNLAGIPVSPTYNNVYVSPDRPAFDTFVRNFRPLYEKGVRDITIPHTTWLRLGLKREFPELFVKNTVLRRVSEASEVARLYEEGFDYVNLDRTLLRNAERLAEIDAAKRHMETKLGKKLYLSILYNESCEGCCPVMDEHYLHNLQRTAATAPYFKSEIAETASCIRTPASSPLYVLKAANVPSYYPQLEHYAHYIDVFKMHGRDNRQVFYDSLRLVHTIYRMQPLIDDLSRLLDRLPEKRRNATLTKFQNCRFDCWKCSWCNELAQELS